MQSGLETAYGNSGSSIYWSACRPLSWLSLYTRFTSDTWRNPRIRRIDRSSEGTIVELYWENSWKGGYYILGWFVCYCLTVICENQDNSIYSFGHIISGHTLKHLLSAGAYGIIAVMMLARR